MSSWLLSVAALSAVAVSSARGEITVDSDSESFSVSLDGVLLMEHTSERPLAAVGVGTFEAVENQGNYEITDEVEETFELDAFQIGYSISN